MRRLVIIIAASLLAGAAVGASVVIRVLSDANPASRLAQGQVVVLQETPFSGHVVNLRMYADPPGHDGSPVTPYVRYIVSVCGSGSFDAILVLSGNARLESPQTIGVQDDPIERSDIGEAHIIAPTTAVDGTPQVFEVSGAQVYLINIAQPPECVEPGDATSQDYWVGSPVRVEGYLSEPLGQRRLFGPWTGAWEWQSWPTIGGFRGQTASGTYFGTGELIGEWFIPPDLRVEATHPLHIDLAVTFVQPEPAAPNVLTWQSADPITPTARLLDLDVHAKLQPWGVVSATASGGMIAVVVSLLFVPGRTRALKMPESGFAASSSPSIPPTVPTEAGHRNEVTELPVRPTRSRSAVCPGLAVALFILSAVAGTVAWRRRRRRGVRS